MTTQGRAETASHPAERARLEQFVLDAEAGIYVHPGYRGFAYSDGAEVEERIYRILREVEDKSLFSEALQARITDWPTEYHFSELRHNLLRHLPFQPSERILELGAGCGAITRQLGESGAQVTAVEGSRLRASCAALRCQGLANVRVYCSDFQQIEFAQPFDYVTLIGVLEYSPVFFGGGDPFGACLELARSALKPGGRLIIAIENRLGLKYFLGFNEDHVGKPYVGIQDLYTPQTAKTLGQEELRALLHRAGFPSSEFHYPFPDYKLPGVLLTDLAFQTDGFNAGEIVGQTRSRADGGSAPPTLCEPLIWHRLADNGLCRALSNSFLVLANQSPEAAPVTPALLGVVYTRLRSPAYKTRTEFRLGGPQRIEAVKSRLLPEVPPPSGPVRHRVGVFPYAPGTLLRTRLLRHYLDGDTAGFCALCQQWIAYVRAHGLEDPADASLQAAVRPEYLDCIPGNLILTETGLEFIDPEWQMASPLDVLIVRGLYDFFFTYRDCLAYPEPTMEDALRPWLARLGVEYDDALQERFLAVGAALASAAHGMTEARKGFLYVLRDQEEAQARHREAEQAAEALKQRVEKRAWDRYIRSRRFLHIRVLRWLKRLLAGFSAL